LLEHNTYDFQVDLTEVPVRERGLTLDFKAVDQFLDTRRERSHATQEKSVVSAAEESVPTEFVGFFVGGI
jgi:alanyl-tRNA synthetase